MPVSTARQGSPPTPRELEVLRAYVQTWSAKRVAHELGISETTVKHHLANVRAKVGAGSTSEAIWRLRDSIGITAA